MIMKLVARGASLLITAAAVVLTSACGARGSSDSGEESVVSGAAEGGVASTSSPSVSDTGQSAPSNGFSESEKLIFEKLLSMEYDPEAGWSEARPNGAKFVYHNEDKPDDIIRAPLDSDGVDLNACSFYVTHQLTAIVDGSNKPITIMISKDKGATWYSATVDLGRIVDSEPYLGKSIGFLDDKNGFLVLTGSNDVCEIFMTDDAGVSWEKSGTYIPTAPFKIEEATFATREIGFLAGRRDGRPFLAKTTDGGKTWKDISGAIEIQPEWEHSFLQRPKFQDQYGIITLSYQPEAPPYPDTLNAESMCLATNDYGETWSFFVMISQNEIPDPESSSDGSQSAELVTPPITPGKVREILDKTCTPIDNAIKDLGINTEGKSVTVIVRGYIELKGEKMYHIVVKNRKDREDELLHEFAISKDLSRFYVDTDESFQLMVDWSKEAPLE